MTRLKWGAAGERRFETGIDRGVLYPITGQGVAWSGLISVTESPTGGEVKPFFMDGIQYQARATPEGFAGSIEAYTYPSEFAVCDGTVKLADGLFATQQKRQPFGLSYRTLIGNDLDGLDHGYKIHLVYNVLATPTERVNQTVSDNPEPDTFTWDISATPAQLAGVRPTSHLIIDSRETNVSVLQALEDQLYGSDVYLPNLPSPLEIVSLYASAGPGAPFVVTDLGGGLFQISGSDAAVQMVDETHFQLSSIFVIDHLDGSYTATSGDDPDGGEDVPFTVEDLGSGLFKISGPDSQVSLTDDNHFQLNTPFVTDNGDGSYTATSA
jgi:hypothetical protein